MPGPNDNQVSPSDPPPPPPPLPSVPPSGPATDPENPDPDPPLQQPPPQQPDPEGGCCKNRSILEKLLLIVLLIIFLLFIAFLIGFFILYYWKGEPRAFCTEDSCVHAAAKINQYIDRSVDPCYDFYQYACGNWIKSSYIPDDEPEVTVYSQIQEHVTVRLRKLLEDPTDEGNTPIQKAKDFYASCVNDEFLESLGSEPFNKLVSNIAKWPSLDNSWNDTDFDLTETLLSLSRTTPFALMPILAMELKPDFENPSAYAVYIGQGNLAVENASRELYLSGQHSRELKAHQNMLEKILVELGADPAEAASDAKEVLDFEIQLANISMSKEQLKNTLYDVTSIDELEATYPDFDWVTFINSLVQYGSAPPQITSADRVILTAPAYVDKLFPLLGKTSDRVLANYLMSTLWRHTAHISQPFRKIIKEYYKELTGTDSLKSRWETCVQLTDHIFPEVTGRLFVGSQFAAEERDNVVSLVDNLRSVFMDIIRQTEWMSSRSKEAAIEKAEALTARIGYPDYIMDDNYLNEKYAEYNMSKVAFFDNSLRVAYLRNAEQVNKFRDTVDTDKWSFSAATVKAYYDRRANQLVFPAGFVQPPIYDASYPRSMNYGGVGSFIGREMTHGFDETGRNFDKEGQARQWWTSEDVENYQKQTECMVNRYSCFRWEPARMNIDGYRTLGENVADNGGLKQSFRAYRHWVEQRGVEEKLLPGLNLTHNQLFFISFAQLWCTNDRDDYKIHKIMTDTYAPSSYRVRGTLQNSPDFAEAFSCSRKSNMNPENKCKVW